ncbi:hypothetical protein ACVWWN_002456 [Mycobacterium sp. URHB0021]
MVAWPSRCRCAVGPPRRTESSPLSGSHRRRLALSWAGRSVRASASWLEEERSVAASLLVRFQLPLTRDSRGHCRFTGLVNRVTFDKVRELGFEVFRSQRASVQAARRLHAADVSKLRRRRRRQRLRPDLVARLPTSSSSDRRRDRGAVDLLVPGSVDSSPAFRLQAPHTHVTLVYPHRSVEAAGGCSFAAIAHLNAAANGAPGCRLAATVSGYRVSSRRHRHGPSRNCGCSSSMSIASCHVATWFRISVGE